MTKKQHYMTREERYQLEALRRAKISVSEIARILGFTRQTIYNELRRGEYVHEYGYYEKKQYSADKGQQIHDYMQTGKGRALKLGNGFDNRKSKYRSGAANDDREEEPRRTHIQAAR